MSLQEAAAEAEALAQAGSERELSQLRARWDDELEAAARSADFRERALAFRAVGMFRWRAKEELLRRGLDDGSPAARGSALLSLEALSRDHPSTVNSVRALLHRMVADEDESWHAFRKLRARYEPLLAVLGRMTDAPRSEWSSWSDDMARHSPPLLRLRRRHVESPLDRH